MEKQMPSALVDFFFIQSFFNWVARVQNLFLRSKSFIHSSLLNSNIHDSSSSKRCKEAVTMTQSFNCRSDKDCDEHEAIKLVMGRLGLVCQHESEDKKLGFDEISTLFDETEPCLTEVKAAFCVFDQNNDGFIDENELNRVMGALGIKEGMGMESCRKMIRDYDENGDGLIDFIEFLKVVEISFC
ncbi:unnamed protein product [Rhodiola kirilowii]